MATASDSQSSGQFSNTVSAMSPAESDGLNRNSFVLPLTSISRRFILSAGMFLDDIFRQSSATAPPSLLGLLPFRYFLPPADVLVCAARAEETALVLVLQNPTLSHSLSFPSLDSAEGNFDANCSSPVLYSSCHCCPATNNNVDDDDGLLLELLVGID